jgi:hypothetical protein
MSPTAGQVVTERFEYDGGRQVTAYVPPAPPEAIVFAGDGQLITSWGGVLEAADLPPTMIIGAHRLDDVPGGWRSEFSVSDGHTAGTPPSCGQAAVTANRGQWSVEVSG